jgi:5-hydroxyisourate hydrolase-like protein (transthyretin family)
MWLQRGRWFAAVAIGLLLLTSAGLWALMPLTAQIRGRVVDAQTGQPLDGVAVDLLWLEQRDGRRVVIGSSGGRVTGSTGTFSMPDLRPGTYGLLFRFIGGRDATEEFGYAPAYYPGVATIDEATSLSLGPGQQVTGLEVRLALVRKTPVSGRVTRSDGTMVGQPAAIRVYPMLEGTMSDARFVDLQADGTFETSLIPGDYLISAILLAKQDEPPFEARLTHEIWDEGTTRVTVGATPVADLSLVTTPGSVFAGRVRFEGNSPLPPQGMRSFYPFTPVFSGDRDRSCRGGYSSEIRADDGTFAMVTMRGRCDAIVQPVLTWPWRIKAIRHAGSDLVGQQIDFDHPLNWRDIEVVLTDRHPTLLLNVTDERGHEVRDYVARRPAGPARDARTAKWLRRLHAR